MDEIITKKEHRSGYTLIDLTVTIVILGVVATLAAVNYSNYLRRIRSQEGVQVLIAVWGAQRDFFRDNGVYFAGDINSADNFGVAINNPPRNFINLQAQSVVCAQPVVASITASDNSYQLGITDTGAIQCCPAALCTRIGF